MQVSVIFSVDGKWQVSLQDGRYFKAMSPADAKKFAKEIKRLADLATRQEDVNRREG